MKKESLFRLTRAAAGAALASTSLCLVGCASNAPEATASASAGDTLASCGSNQLKVASASASSAASGFPASAAIDGNLNTSWTSSGNLSQWLQLDMGAVVFIGNLKIDFSSNYAVAYQIQVSSDNDQFTTVAEPSATQAGWQTIAGLNVTARYIRINTINWTQSGKVSIIEAQVIGDTNAACASVESGCGQTVQLVPTTAKASSQQLSDTPASNAIDNNFSTRWSSNSTDNEWLAVDLGSQSRVDSVRITWETAFASSYAIQSGTSLTGPWTTVVTNTNGQGDVESLTVGATTRFLRLLGIKRGTQYGYSLWQFDVYGSHELSCGSNLMTGWNHSASSTNLVAAGNYSFDTTNANKINFPLSNGSGCTSDGGPPFFTFVQTVSVPAGHTFRLALNIANVTGSANEVNFAVALGNAPASNYVPASNVIGSPNGPITVAQLLAASGTMGADFAVNSTTTQSMQLSISAYPPAISTGGSCLAGFLDSFTLASATLTKVN
jgi:hypothetical protein